MDKDIRFIYNEYNEVAMRIFFSLFNKFREEADSIERNGYENVFQMLKGKYVKTLKMRLEQSASVFIENCDSAEIQGRLRIGFSEKISWLTREFYRKSTLI